jgi:hypothetical protein
MHSIFISQLALLTSSQCHGRQQSMTLAIGHDLSHLNSRGVRVHARAQSPRSSRLDRSTGYRHAALLPSNAEKHLLRSVSIPSTPHPRPQTASLPLSIWRLVTRAHPSWSVIMLTEQYGWIGRYRTSSSSKLTRLEWIGPAKLLN